LIYRYLTLPLVKLKYNIMQQGTVKFFNETKGFGFITPSNGDAEIFVHASGLIDNIRENDTVNYDVEEGRKGLNAVNVKVA
jgi:cold shock protein